MATASGAVIPRTRRTLAVSAPNQFSQAMSDFSQAVAEEVRNELDLAVMRGHALLGRHHAVLVSQEPPRALVQRSRAPRVRVDWRIVAEGRVMMRRVLGPRRVVVSRMVAKRRVRSVPGSAVWTASVEAAGVRTNEGVFDGCVPTPARSAQAKEWPRDRREARPELA